MLAAETQPRALRVAIAGMPYEVTVVPCPMSALVAGEHIVAPDGQTLLDGLTTDRWGWRW